MTSFDELPKAYATLRFAGDELDPADISALLPVAAETGPSQGRNLLRWSAGRYARRANRDLVFRHQRLGEP